MSSLAAGKSLSFYPPFFLPPTLVRPEILFGIAADHGFETPVDLGKQIGDVAIFIACRREADRIVRNHAVMEGYRG